ncbi:DUF1328 domain-containing protein [Salegentibacter salegens]|jgi:uncharacterized membrane protein YtjA (UPF0391 family)|uniref:DUF1328 domain-containing protein n=1 Tax=Salegentibacter salegens TaxID=143223 RepID=A0A1M7NQR4_9FLAO|nr:DUF1328 domain-containing protein [Salegentibacter salegens]PRX41064.1 uncharacterized protein DUF1328 [Salegentibacter salegens]SHN06297.1 Protein of unknown function [Salegentibacter salegens]
MRKYSTLFLIVAVLTGAIGFSGLSFAGIEVVRVLFLIFADLLVVSLVARLFFRNDSLKLQRIKK